MVTHLSMTSSSLMIHILVITLYNQFINIILKGIKSNYFGNELSVILLFNGFTSEVFGHLQI